ncbi:MAG TPA: nuclear transport factor 2 family protein [Gemmatimonadales bacterium]
MSRLTLTAVIMLLTATRAIAQSPDEVVRAFHEALARADSGAALAVLDPDVVIYESGGVESSRDEYRTHHLEADMAFASATTRAVTATRADVRDAVAIVLSQSRTTGTFRDREIDASGTETMLLRRTPDGWRIVHIHWSSRNVRRAGESD